VILTGTAAAAVAATGNAGPRSHLVFSLLSVDSTFTGVPTAAAAAAADGELADRDTAAGDAEAAAAGAAVLRGVNSSGFALNILQAKNDIQTYTSGVNEGQLHTI